MIALPTINRQDLRATKPTKRQLIGPLASLPAGCRALADRLPNARHRFLSALTLGAWPTLLSHSVKVDKGLKYGLRTGVMYLAPYNDAGVNICPHASAGCAAACLGNHSGRMVMPTHREARVLRTWLFFAARERFISRVRRDVIALRARAEREGYACFVRLNGASDIPWESIASSLFDIERVAFYDYTKHVGRALAFARGEMPANYHVTFSRSETNEADCLRVLRAGGNVAAVFADPDLAKASGWSIDGYHFPALDGDETDARPTDARGHWVVLSPKGGPARRDTSGFVIQNRRAS